MLVTAANVLIFLIERLNGEEFYKITRKKELGKGDFILDSVTKFVQNINPWL